MADQWIDAATALRIAATSSTEHAAAGALCRRAHAGLVRTRARLFVAGEERVENLELPAKFWWPEDGPKLDATWSTGDFAAPPSAIDPTPWAPDRSRVKAFGVTFALDDVLGLLPTERRAVARRMVSVSGSAEWLPTREATGFVLRYVPVQDAGSLLLDQLRLGFIPARAVLAERFEPRSAWPTWSTREMEELGRKAWEAREWDVGDWFWHEFTSTAASSQDWGRGIFTGLGTAENGQAFMRLTDVHVLRESVEALRPRESRALAAPNEPAPAEAGLVGEQRPTRGGRPAQPWWDELWCAVWGLIHQGDLKPDTQADVERAILTWAAMNGHELSETAVKPKARKLFQAYKGEVTNFLDPSL